MNLIRLATLALVALLAVSPAHAWQVKKDGATQLKLTDVGSLVIGGDTPIASEKLSVPLGANQGARIGNWASDGSVALFVTPSGVNQAGMFVRGIAGQAADIFRVESSASSLFMVNSAGGVGVGIGPDPNFRMQVRDGQTAGHTALFRSTSPSGTYVGIFNETGSAGAYYLTTWSSGSFSIHRPGVGDRLTIDSTGNVGIGTTTPTAKLEVAGQVKITGGSPGAGKVLTSDAAGLASWQTPSGGGSGAVIGGRDVDGILWGTGNGRWGQMSCSSGTPRCMSRNGDGQCVSYLCIQ